MVIRQTIEGEEVLVTVLSCCNVFHGPLAMVAG